MIILLNVEINIWYNLIFINKNCYRIKNLKEFFWFDEDNILKFF